MRALPWLGLASTGWVGSVMVALWPAMDRFRPVLGHGGLPQDTGVASYARSRRDRQAQIVGPIGRWKGPHPPEDEHRASNFAALRAAWRALLAVFAARGLDSSAQLAARAAAVGVAPFPYRWSPPPVLLPHADPPFTIQFSGAGVLHLLTMADRTVTLESEGRATARSWRTSRRRCRPS